MDMSIEEHLENAALETISWNCAFCPKQRVYEGGRPGLAEHCDWCPTCEYLCVTDPDDRSAIARLIDKHLI